MAGAGTGSNAGAGTGAGASVSTAGEGTAMAAAASEALTGQPRRCVYMIGIIDTLSKYDAKSRAAQVRVQYGLCTVRVLIPLPLPQSLLFCDLAVGGAASTPII